MQSLKALHESLGVFIWDPFPILCDAPVCSAFRDGEPLFVDGDHLSGYGNRVLVPSFVSELRDVWKEEASAAIYTQPLPDMAGEMHESGKPN